MIPYFWFSLIYIFIVLYSLLISKVVPLKTLFVQLWYVAGMFGMNVLWFLPALFAAEVLFLYITQRFKINKSVIVIIALCIVAAIVNYLRAYLPNNLVIYERTGRVLSDTFLVNKDGKKQLFIKVDIDGLKYNVLFFEQDLIENNND